LAKSFFLLLEIENLFCFYISCAEKVSRFQKYNTFISKINSPIFYSNSCAKIHAKLSLSFIPEDIEISNLSGDERSRVLIRRQLTRVLLEPKAR